MPVGNELTPMIQPSQAILPTDSSGAIMFDDNAAATIVWMDFQRAMSWLDTNSWLAEWQYVDYIYQSPNYDRDWRMQTNRPARISRFNVAKNRNTMSTQVRRGVLATPTPSCSNRAANWRAIRTQRKYSRRGRRYSAPSMSEPISITTST